jgi:hypothetical protein
MHLLTGIIQKDLIVMDIHSFRRLLVVVVIHQAIYTDELTSSTQAQIVP